MNKLKGVITNINNVGELSKVDINVGGYGFSALIIDIDRLLHVGSSIGLLFKESEVLVATKESKVSARNAFVSTVLSVEKGTLLSMIKFDFLGNGVASMITTASVETLKIKEGEEFLWFVKANEITLQRSEDGE